MPELHKFLIEYYSMNSNEYFHVYNIDLVLRWFNDPEADLSDYIKELDAKNAFDSFIAACSRLYRTRFIEDTVIFYNNSAWLVVSAETIKGAIEKFWDILSQVYLSPGEV